MTATDTWQLARQGKARQAASRGFVGPQFFTLLDIKTFDFAGATHVNAHGPPTRRTDSLTVVSAPSLPTYATLAS